MSKKKKRYYYYNNNNNKNIENNNIVFIKNDNNSNNITNKEFENPEHKDNVEYTTKISLINEPQEKEQHQNNVSDNIVKENDLEYDIKTNNIINKINKKRIELQEVFKDKSDFYLGYYSRVTLLLLSVLTLLSLTLIFIFSSLNTNNASYLTYSENSNVDYKVYLKANNFYEEEYLNKDKVYVASLIDKINVNFNYNFASEKALNALFKYNIMAKILITDANEQNTYYEKEYILLEEKTSPINSQNSNTINETINIDYNNYNKIANNFKNSYSLNAKSKLIIYFNINTELFDKNDQTISNKPGNMYLEIPLSEKSVEIKLNSNNINTENKITLRKNNKKLINFIFILMSIATLILLGIALLKLIKLTKHLFISDNVYDNYINKLLNEYDRLVIKTNTPPVKNNKDKENIIIVESFEELLDVRDSLKQPIMYYIITKHIKCQFYIKHEGKIYLTTIKKVDLEAENVQE